MVTRSAQHISAQVIDDVAGRTLASASTMEADVRSAERRQVRQGQAGRCELSPTRAKAAGVEQVVFDRAGNKYHGRIAALADGAREGRPRILGRRENR